MIDVVCDCKSPRQVHENRIGDAFPCDKCAKVVRLVSAEMLDPGNGAGDFDATLTIIDGPDRIGERIQLGGISEIAIGKSIERHINLVDAQVSRHHAKLVRQDFGPSQWRIVDTRSTNGLFVNDGRVAEHVLRDGDVIRIGGYRLQFGHVVAYVPPPSGVSCPGCEKQLPKKAKICVECGINILTGKPVLTRQGVDENSLYAAAESWIRLISLLVWVTPFPIPIRSDAFGTRKSYAIWTVAVATILASITFFVAERMHDGQGDRFAGTNLMLWPPQAAGTTAAMPFSKQQVHDMAGKLDAEDRADLAREYAKPGEKPTDDVLIERALTAYAASTANERGEFHPYQLVTHAFLHDSSSIYNFAMHLGGNLVFLLCFGTRVNALIGNVATAILYPILAISAASVHLLSDGSGGGPMVGASGAIMGLAGMYLVLFPVHNVYCAMWISVIFRFRRYFSCKIFSLRGFWILLIYFGYDIAMNVINARFGGGDNVAHWAHIGGFLTGATLGMALLLSRQFDTHGGDILSVVLGKRAWAIIGKPGRKNRPAEPAGTPAYA